MRGVNVIGMHRHHFEEAVIERLKQACRLLYRRDTGTHADGIDQVEQQLGSDPVIAEVCAFARRATMSENGRYKEARRPDNKRQSPAL